MLRKIRGSLMAPRDTSFHPYSAHQLLRVHTGALAKGNADVFAFAWQNPHADKIWIVQFATNITTAGGTGSSVLYVGPGATATTEATGITNDIDLNATGYTHRGGAIMDKKGGTLDFLTGRIKTANAAALEGSYYLYYFVIEE